MSAITKEQAVQRISAEIERFGRDDLVETHNELFPDAPPGSAETDETRLIAAIRDHIRRGLEIEELVDLWHVVFPKDRNVWYDVDNDVMRTNEGFEHAD